MEFEGFDYAKIKKALIALKTTCMSAKDCYQCPLGSFEGICCLERHIPEHWHICEEKGHERLLDEGWYYVPNIGGDSE